MFKRLIYFLSLFLFACTGSDADVGNNSSFEINTADTANDITVDSLREEPIQMSEEIAELFKSFPDTFHLPFTVDSAFIQERSDMNRSEGSQFDYQTVRDLIHNGYGNGPGLEQQYMLNATIEIDSFKHNGAYEEYVAGLDIGMLKDAYYHGEGIINLPDHRQILIWTMDYSSYEACPYYTGTVIYGTLMDRYEIKNTIELAESTSSGDPPAWGETSAQSEISEANIVTHYQEAYGETAEPEYGYEGRLEESDSKHIVIIDSTGFVEQIKE